MRRVEVVLDYVGIIHGIVEDGVDWLSLHVSRPAIMNAKTRRSKNIMLLF